MPLVQTSVSLELPGAKTQNAEVVLIQADGSAPPVKHALDVPKDGTAGSMYALLAQVTRGPRRHRPSLAASRGMVVLGGTGRAGYDNSAN